MILDLPDGYDTRSASAAPSSQPASASSSASPAPGSPDPTVLILDEATSNLDVATEARVQQALRRLRDGRTTIIIAPRLSTVVEADQIAVIDGGRVVEVGPPADLIERGGCFAELYGCWLASAA